MSIITDESSRAFKEARRFKKSNSEIKIEPSGNVYFRLFGNLIAMHSPRAKELTINDCGRQTQTTKDRLNGILSEFGLGSIIQKHGVWYLIHKDGLPERRKGSHLFRF